MDDLTYLSQTNDYYTVKSASGEVLNIPKKREGTPVPYPVGGKFSVSWLKLAFFGLSLGGILTIIFAPLVFLKNESLIRSRGLSTQDLIHSKNYLYVSLILFLFGAIFFALFLIHLIFS